VALFIAPTGNCVDKVLIVFFLGTIRNGERLPMRLSHELWRANVRHSNLNGPQPWAAQFFPL
jgi:hypothetical protein